MTNKNNNLLARINKNKVKIALAAGVIGGSIVTAYLMKKSYEGGIDSLKSEIKSLLDDQHVIWDTASVESGLISASEVLNMTGDAVTNETKESIMASIVGLLEDAYGKSIKIYKIKDKYKLTALEQGE